MGTKLAPKGKSCRIVTTKKIEDDIAVACLDHKEGFIYFNLSDLSKQTEHIQAYVTPLIEQIKAGDYETPLVDMNDEEVCC
ncbi:hypothetical protein GCM10012290_11750 [Halolactibacillus alkaliphilus]|uniref:Uncharacterized protein n=1 Tax=Halolactibacillus alkaliphilus TaxID=442899 RepID=A0A511X0T7_9BACI|nr:hypothetical protein [Halolactibacillus alkaliphilus]GEN56563.1 hypothetical protein HAL01_10270 [Halolactibacillus alkaliphilus]GGN69254.1 hypothetical protein GCM10012290_11750 [Halolactibacillus alkaliphilus]SFO75221.1 hypothetical protein SAMN05720591_10873 [Halolactibacillus alkaliphilus]